jgi:phage terminase large subunit GpA-like protein
MIIVERENAQLFLNAMCLLAEPLPRMLTSEFAEKYINIPRGQSDHPGPWRNDLAPHTVEIMNAADDPNIHHMVIMKGARTSISESLKNIMFKRIKFNPCQILYVLPTGDLAEKYSKKILSKSILQTPIIAELIAPEKSRDSHNTILEKEFPDGDLSIIGSNSPAGMRMVSKELVILDDRSGFPVSSGVEGDPASLAETRGDTFHNFLLIEASSPTIQNFCPIEKSFLMSDQRYFYVPCPHCGKEQRLLWSGIKWTNNNPKTTVYQCCECGNSILEKHKYEMMNAGHYIPHADFNGIAGWHISQLYSLFIKWEKIVGIWLKSYGDREKLKVFVNTRLGETSKEEGVSVNTNELYDRAEEYPLKIPHGAAIITASVDTQDDRLECLIKAWGKDEESWDIELKLIYGNLALPDVWSTLDEYLLKPFTHENGAKLYVACAVIDSGGHFTDRVYEFVKPREHRNIFAIKGSSLRGVPIVSRPQKKAGAKSTDEDIYLYHVGTYAAKEIVQSRLELKEIKPGYIHLSKRFDYEYYEQLASEQKVLDYHKGVMRGYKWKPIRKRTEGWDLQVYGLAALRIVYPNTEGLNQVVDFVNNTTPDADGNIVDATQRPRVISRGVG